MNLDAYDKKIIKELSSDGRMSVSELADRIGLSKTPCQNRLKRLIENEYISGFKAIVNHAKLDMEMVAFTEVTMSDTKESALAAFNTAVSKVPNRHPHRQIGQNSVLNPIETISKFKIGRIYF